MHMKRHSTLCVIREMQIKTTAYRLQWPRFGTLTTPNADKDVKYQELLFIAGENVKWYSHFEKQCGSFLKN